MLYSLEREIYGPFYSRMRGDLIGVDFYSMINID